MMESINFCSPSRPVIIGSNGFSDSKPSGTKFGSTIRCSSTRNVPKLEPFSRSNFDRLAKDPPLIEKSENELADYCSTLDGDDSYGCWRAYFELKEIEREETKEEVEKLILQAGGVKSLIGFVHGVASVHKKKKEVSPSKPLDTNQERTKPFHVPDGLPKSQSELEEDEEARMLDSPFTRLLRSKGTFPAWYSQAPDHETD